MRAHITRAAPVWPPTVPRCDDGGAVMTVPRCDGGAGVQVRADAKKLGISETQDALFAFFLERVRTNLHVVLCLSPIGEAFRERCRMFPGLVNCTTIDWFTPWPSDALFEVASKLLESADVGTAEIRTAVCQVWRSINWDAAMAERNDPMHST